MYLGIPDGHGPWCGCGACQACTRYSVNHYGAPVATELYRAQLAEVEALVKTQQLLHLSALEYQASRYAPPSQSHIVERVECALPHHREPRSAAFTLTIMGMLVALAFVSELLWAFH
jgi:hypothetical protein